MDTVVVEVPPVLCDYCGGMFSNATDMRNHMVNCKLAPVKRQKPPKKLWREASGHDGTAASSVKSEDIVDQSHIKPASGADNAMSVSAGQASGSEKDKGTTQDGVQAPTHRAKVVNGVLIYEVDFFVCSACSLPFATAKECIEHQTESRHLVQGMLIQMLYCCPHCFACYEQEEVCVSHAGYQCNRKPGAQVAEVEQRSDAVAQQASVPVAPSGSSTNVPLNLTSKSQAATGPLADATGDINHDLLAQQQVQQQYSGNADSVLTQHLLAQAATTQPPGAVPSQQASPKVDQTLYAQQPQVQVVYARNLSASLGKGVTVQTSETTPQPAPVTQAAATAAVPSSQTVNSLTQTLLGLQTLSSLGIQRGQASTSARPPALGLPDPGMLQVLTPPDPNKPATTSNTVSSTQSGSVLAALVQKADPMSADAGSSQVVLSPAGQALLATAALLSQEQLQALDRTTLEQLAALQQLWQLSQQTPKPQPPTQSASATVTTTTDGVQGVKVESSPIAQLQGQGTALTVSGTQDAAAACEMIQPKTEQISAASGQKANPTNKKVQRKASKSKSKANKAKQNLQFQSTATAVKSSESPLTRKGASMEEIELYIRQLYEENIRACAEEQKARHMAHRPLKQNKLNKTTSSASSSSGSSHIEHIEHVEEASATSTSLTAGLEPPQPSKILLASVKPEDEHTVEIPTPVALATASAPMVADLVIAETSPKIAAVESDVQPAVVSSTHTVPLLSTLTVETTTLAAPPPQPVQLLPVPCVPTAAPELPITPTETQALLYCPDVQHQEEVSAEVSTATAPPPQVSTVPAPGPQSPGTQTQLPAGNAVRMEMVIFKNVEVIRVTQPVCTICEVHLASEKEVKEHKNTKCCKEQAGKIIREMDFYCPHCSRSFPSLKLCRSHQLTGCLKEAGLKIRELSSKQFQCQLCEKKYFDAPTLQRHLTAYHYIDAGTAKTKVDEWFPKSFMQSMFQALNTERREKSPRRDRSRKSNSTTETQASSKKHIKDQLYECSRCQTKFPRSQTLMIHQRVCGKDPSTIPVDIPGGTGILDASQRTTVAAVVEMASPQEIESNLSFQTMVNALPTEHIDVDLNTAEEAARWLCDRNYQDEVPDIEVPDVELEDPSRTKQKQQTKSRAKGTKAKQSPKATQQSPKSGEKKGTAKRKLVKKGPASKKAKKAVNKASSANKEEWGPVSIAEESVVSYTNIQCPVGELKVKVQKLMGEEEEGSVEAVEEGVDTTQDGQLQADVKLSEGTEGQFIAGSGDIAAGTAYDDIEDCKPERLELDKPETGSETETKNKVGELLVPPTAGEEALEGEPGQVTMVTGTSVLGVATSIKEETSLDGNDTCGTDEPNLTIPLTASQVMGAESSPSQPDTVVSGKNDMSCSAESNAVSTGVESIPDRSVSTQEAGPDAADDSGSVPPATSQDVEPVTSTGNSDTVHANASTEYEDQSSSSGATTAVTNVETVAMDTTTSEPSVSMVSDATKGSSVTGESEPTLATSSDHRSQGETVHEQSEPTQHLNNSTGHQSPENTQDAECAQSEENSTCTTSETAAAALSTGVPSSSTDVPDCSIGVPDSSTGIPSSKANGENSLDLPPSELKNPEAPVSDITKLESAATQNSTPDVVTM